MLGIKYIKTQPNTYTLQYKKGKVVKAGAGLSFFYFAPSTSLVAVPLASTDQPFMFTETTADFQEVTVQGQVTYRVEDPKKLSTLMNYTLGPNTRGYASEDPKKLPQRVIQRIQVCMRERIQKYRLREVLRASDELVAMVREDLAESEMIEQLGLSIIALSLLAIKPNPETARALEAEIREQLLQEADEAIYVRRNASIEQERAVQENELNTEIAVENKKREVREARIEADRAAQQKKQLLREEGMNGKIALEEKNTEFVKIAVDNKKAEAEAQAFGLKSVMDVFNGMDPKVTQALAGVGMNPGQLIAVAFQSMAENADKIGTLNIAPELLQELMASTRSEE